MTKKICLMLTALSAFSGVSQASSVDTYYATLNLGMGFKNKMPASGSSLANATLLINQLYDSSLVAADHDKKADFKNKLGFSGDVRFGRDFQLGHSCGFMGLFAGIGLGGGSSTAKASTTQKVESKDTLINYKLSVSQKMYIPLGMRVGYSFGGTKVFLTLGYAPQRVQFTVAEAEKTSYSKTVGSFLVGLGFATPVSQNAYLGLSVETCFGKLKAPKKFTEYARTQVAQAAKATFDANAKKGSSYVQTRVLLSFTYAIPSSR
jgi:hypothetical protein